MDNPLKLYFISINPENEVEKEFYITTIANLPDRFRVCGRPSEADLLILTGFSKQEHFGLIHKLPEVAKYQEKTIIISEWDHPVELLPGFYSSGSQSSALRDVMDGWHFPFLNERFPNQNLQLSNQESQNKRNFLASFLGYPSHIIRIQLAKLFGQFPDMSIQVTKDYHHFEMNKDLAAKTRQQRYAELFRNSQFSLCPRGRGPSSMRLYDSMRFGVVPVVISDEWVRPSFVDWESCSIQVKEKHLKHLHEILIEHQGDCEKMGQAARAVYENHFAEDRLAITLESALRQLMSALKTHKKTTPWFALRTRLSRCITFKAVFYKAVIYNRLNNH